MKRNRVVLAAIVAVGAMVSAQCSSSQTSLPTAPGASSTGVTTRAVGESTTSVPAFTQIKVCKDAASGVAGTFTVAYQNPADPFTVNVALLASPFVVNPGACVVAAESAATVNGTPITITENSADALTTVSAQRIDDPGAVVGPQPFANGDSLYLNLFHGYAITFLNPVAASEGCTPGYWGQPHHLDSWAATGFTTGQDFDATFSVNFFSPNITLLQAVNLNGGGVKALARHGVAALLSSAHPGVDYLYSTAEVIDIVQGDGAFAGLTVNERKDLLAAQNNLGCPLN